jgi:competence protein ComEC
MLTVILITLAIILGVDPMLTRSIGFELSVTAVCGIGIALFFFRRVRLAPVWRVLGSALAVSVGATITTAPLTMYYFGTLSIVGLITNLLVVPLLPAITYLSIAALFVSEAFSGLGIAIAFLVHILMSWILFVATALASIPYGHAEEVRISLRAVLLYYACLVAGIIGLMRYFKISWRQWWI